MSSTLVQTAAIVAGLAISTTTFIVTPRSPFKGLAIAVTIAIVGALLLTAARHFG